MVEPPKGTRPGTAHQVMSQAVEALREYDEITVLTLDVEIDVNRETIRSHLDRFAKVGILERSSRRPRKWRLGEKVRDLTPEPPRSEE